MKDAIAQGIRNDRRRRRLKEFARIYVEAQTTAKDHGEFLENLYEAAVNLNSGKWKAP